MVKNKTLAFVLFIALFLIIWNLLDFLYSALITGNGYGFAAGGDLFIPLVVSVVVGYLFFLRKK